MTREKRVGEPSLPPLSVFLDAGVVPRDSRGDNRNQLGEDLTKYLVVEPGDVVFNKLRAWQGGIGHSSYRGIVSPAYYVCRPASGYYSRYLHYLLRSTPYLAELTRISKHMPPSQFDTPWEMLRLLPILTPSMEEQRRIADFLDGETFRIASLQKKFSRILGLLTEREQRILFDCFDFSGDAEANFPALRRVVLRWIDYRGATPEKVVSGVPLVTAKNISDGRIDFDASREFISSDSYDEWMRRGLPEKGDVLLTTEAPLGEVAIVEDPGIALAQRVILLRADRDAVSPEWLYWYLRSPQGSATLQMWATGSTALGIKADRLKGLSIPVVSFAESARRIERVDSSIAGIDRLRTRIDRQIALLAERRQALITAAVTGRLDVTTASGRNLTQGV